MQVTLMLQQVVHVVISYVICLVVVLQVRSLYQREFPECHLLVPPSKSNIFSFP